MPELAGLRAVVSGRVQGVFFRDFTRQKALELGLKGYAKNKPDGLVEVEAEGERQALEKLLAHLRQGPPRSTVEKVTVTWGIYTGKHAGFVIRY